MSTSTAVLERIAPPVWAFQPDWTTANGNYEVRLVRTAAELDAALRLRFEVFNLELREGLATSYLTGRDQDSFDARCRHLIAIDNTTGQMVGTYRLQTLDTAGDRDGFYTAGEFDLGNLPLEVLSDSVEIGRACVALAQRNSQVLLLLWQGLMRFLAVEQKRYFFGCCSLTSQNESEGWAIYRQLSDQGQLHAALRVVPRPQFACRSIGVTLDPPGHEPRLPRLFRAYLRFGAKVCGPPAIDRQFRTIDYFVICDTNQLTPAKRQLLTGA
jgi:putative hemolysin